MNPSASSPSGFADQRLPGKPPESRRKAERARAVLLLGRLQLAESDVLCMVVDISRFGAKVRSTLPLEPGMEVILEMEPWRRLPGTVRWCAGGTSGIEFALDEAGEQPIPDEGADRRRKFPRFRRSAYVSMRVADRLMGGDLIEISPGGLSVLVKRMAPNAALGMPVALAVSGMEPRHGRITRLDGRLVALTFDVPCNFREFDGWLSAREAPALSHAASG